MFLTMNRFKVRPGQEAAFEAIWTGRDSHLPEVKGFVAFHLMKGPEREGYRLYASHTLWDSEQAFTDWTRSEAFRAAHRGAGAHAEIYLGPPELEIFEAVQTMSAAQPD
jgi:heme-degrading monooxygenase HmoA